jgi:hypothetical protein
MWPLIVVGVALGVLLFAVAVAYSVGSSNGRAAQKLAQEWSRTEAAEVQPAPVQAPQSVIDGRAAEQVIGAEVLAMLARQAFGDQRPAGRPVIDLDKAREIRRGENHV